MRFVFFNLFLWHASDLIHCFMLCEQEMDRQVPLMDEIDTKVRKCFFNEFSKYFSSIICYFLFFFSIG